MSLGPEIMSTGPVCAILSDLLVEMQGNNYNCFVLFFCVCVCVCVIEISNWSCHITFLSQIFKHSVFSKDCDSLFLALFLFKIEVDDVSEG